MKNLSVLIIIALVLLSCESSERKAHKLIKEYLEKNLNDFSSYESVEFGSMDSSFATFEDSHKQLILRYENLLSERKTNIELAQSSLGDIDGSKYEFYMNKEKAESDSADKLIAIIDKLRMEYKPEFNGWLVHHKFRSNNNQGSIILHHYVFRVYNDFSGIGEYYDLNKNGLDSSIE